MDNNQQLIVITGPTATGKTTLGIALAKQLGGEVVSADSMQIYKGLDIGTAKPTAEEMDSVPHHMLDIVPATENYSVAQYVIDASKCVDDILSRGKQPIVVGGSGLYIDSLIRGRAFVERGDPKLRKQLEARFDKLGGRAMLCELSKLDKPSADKLHPNDKKRIVRALEAVIATGIPLSEHDAEEKKLPNKYGAVKYALTFCDRAVLYDRINRRVDTMVRAGLIDEAQSLLRSGVPRSCTAMQAIGYKEIADALLSGANQDSEIANAIATIKMESTRYAKRQLTWLRRDKNINWITWQDAPDIDNAVRAIITG